MNIFCSHCSFYYLLHKPSHPSLPKNPHPPFVVLQERVIQFDVEHVVHITFELLQLQVNSDLFFTPFSPLLNSINAIPFIILILFAVPTIAESKSLDHPNSF